MTTRLIRKRPRKAATLRRSSMYAGLLLGLGSQADAAQFGVVVAPEQDPLMANVTIPATAPTQGMWSGVLNWPSVPIHTAMLPNGFISSYGTPTGSGVQDGRTYDTWNPLSVAANPHVTLPGVTGVDSFCSTSSLLTQGSLLISGGIIDPATNTNDHGSVTLNPNGSQISPVPYTLADDRYYSTMIMLASGQPLIMGGTFPYAGQFGFGASNPTGYLNAGYGASMTPEIFSPTTGWRSLFGASSRTAFGPDYDRYWYPRAWQAPNGQVFGISTEQMWYLDPTGNGSMTSAGTFKTPEVTAMVGANAVPNVGPTSTAVMYDVGKILQVGGNGYYNNDPTVSSSQATTFDITNGAPVVKDTSSMAFGRQWPTATVLPTGKVLVTGGSTFSDNAGANAVTATETWDPSTGQWSVGPSEAYYRGYHSTATLLQSGAVLSGGGGVPGPMVNFNAQVYFPPYLFTTVNGQATWAVRPNVVSLASNQLSIAQSTQVELDSANPIAKVAFIRLSSTTHSFNTGQRYIGASFTQNGSILTIQTPASANIAPPGYYQLVVINGNGVPSPGVIVALGSGVVAPPSSVVPTNVVTPLASGAWSTCANEGGGCTLTGTQTIAFGSAPYWVQKTTAGSVPCTTAAFGADPAYGVAKTCQVLAGSSASATGAGSSSSGTSGTTGAGTGTGTTSTAGTGTPTTGTASQGGVAASAPSTAPIGYYATAIAAAPDGTLATVNSQTGTIWVSNLGTNWQPLPGAFIDLAVMGSNRYYAIGTDHNVYRYAGGTWTQVGNNAIAIAASSDGAIAVVNDQSGMIWYKPTDDNQFNWQPIPGAYAKRVAMMNKNSVYFVGTDGNVWRGTPQNNPTQIGVNATDIAASSDGTVTVVSSTNNVVGSLWRKTGDNTVVNWAPLPGTAVRIASPTQSILIKRGSDSNIYRQ